MGSGEEDRIVQMVPGIFSGGMVRMGSISEYFHSLLIPYSRCLYRNFEILKNPIFLILLLFFPIKKWNFLKIQNYGAEIYCKVSTARKNIQRLIPYV